MLPYCPEHVSRHYCLHYFISFDMYEILYSGEYVCHLRILWASSHLLNTLSGLACSAVSPLAQIQFALFDALRVLESRKKTKTCGWSSRGLHVDANY